MIKQVISPLCKRGARGDFIPSISPLWKKGARGDFILSNPPLSPFF